MNLPSKSLQRAVDSFSALPGIGSKTALRFVLSLLNKPKSKILDFSESLKELAEHLYFCEACHNITEQNNTLCTICASPKRDTQTICVIENLKDLMTLEKSSIFNGMYHILGGVISPMDGISPSSLHIESLIRRIVEGNIKEIVFALPTTMDGDTTCFYIYKKIKDHNIKISTLARGISIGDELEYTDEVTLAKSLANRIPFEQSIASR